MEGRIREVYKAADLKDTLLKLQKIQKEIDFTYAVGRECMETEHWLALYEAVERIGSLENEKKMLLSSLDSERKDIIIKLLG